MRKSLVLALVTVLALTAGATALAKPKKPPFKTGQYTGTVTSAISGKEPASHTVRLTISKIGKRYKVQLTSFVVKVTCDNKPRTQGLLFGVIYVSKKTGRFSGKTVPGHSPGTATVSGQANGKQINATWNYSVPNGSCWGNGNVAATHP
jgi:hypothetical protein